MDSNRRRATDLEGSTALLIFSVVLMERHVFSFKLFGSGPNAFSRRILNSFPFLRDASRKLTRVVDFAQYIVGSLLHSLTLCPFPYQAARFYLLPCLGL